MRAAAAIAGLITLACVSVPRGAAAYVPSLLPEQVSSAAAIGRAAAKSHEGLSAKSYTAFATSDALDAAPHAGSIDAIVVGTPFERVEYAAYVAAFEGRPATADEISGASTAHTLDIVIFAHSRDQLDQRFLRRFRGATLVVGRTKRDPVSTSTAAPAKDFFNTSSGRQLLWLGSVSYRFDMTGVGADAVVKFVLIDPYGRAYDVRIDLSKYR